MTGAGAPVVRAPVDLDVTTSADVFAQVAQALSAGAERVVLDLSDVAFCDSYGLRSLVNGAKLARRSAAAVLEVVHAPPSVLRLARMSGLTTLLRLPDEPPAPA